MLIFLSLLLTVVSLVYLAGRVPESAGVRTFFVTAAISSLVLVASVRNVSVGTDTENYVQFYESIDDLLSALAMGLLDNEYGFWLLNWFAKFISDDYAALLFVIAAVCVGGYLYSIYRNSCDPAVSVFVYITGGFYTFFLNGARQGIACAISAVAIRYLVSREFKKYLILVIIATFFHKTAVVMLPLYFIAGSTASLGRLALYGLLGCVAALSLESVVSFGASIDPRYADYAVSGEGGGFVMVAFNLALCAFFFLMKPLVSTHRVQYETLLNLLVFGAIVSCISAVFRIAPSGILRLNLYFSVGTLFLWPIVFANVTAPLFRIYLRYFFALTYLTFFMLSLARFGDLVPYTVNPTFSLDLF